MRREAALPSQVRLGYLTPAWAMTHNSPRAELRRSINLEAGQGRRVTELQRLRADVEHLRAARKRLVSAADEDRRTIERDLHDGVHQHLIALAVKLQLAEQAADADPAAAKSILEEMRRDVQQALDETALLAQRVYPAALEAGSLRALLRSAAVNARISASVDVDAWAKYPPEVAMTVYLCWLTMLARWSGDARVTITAREGEDDLVFDIVASADPSAADLDRMRDRVEALGGRLAVAPLERGSTRVSGTLPLSR